MDNIAMVGVSKANVPPCRTGSLKYGINMIKRHDVPVKFVYEVKQTGSIFWRILKCGQMQRLNMGVSCDKCGGVVG